MVEIKKLLNKRFIIKNTSFDDVSEFIKIIGIGEEEFENIFEINCVDLDSKISKFTKFNSWRELLETAKIDYVERKILGEIDF